MSLARLRRNIENHDDSRTSILENKPREEFRAFNNNNDNKYLHKKFKKMASSSTVLQQDNSGLNHITNLYENISNSQSSSQPSSYHDVLPPRRSDAPSNQNVSSSATSRPLNVAQNKYSAVKNNETENNVQINHKDYNSEKSSAGVKSNPNVDHLNSGDGKISAASDLREAYETKDSPNVAGNGRHVCPYCNLSCAKPSVLQKHIRAHTNERPYPCVPCGFAFKTKSNLYKHCRSRSHALRLHGKDETPNNEEEWSLGSEADVNSANKTEWNADRLNSQMDPASVNDNLASDSLSERLSPSNTTNLQVDSKPKSIYKPKFHKASFYQEEDDTYKNVFSPSPEFLNRHISKIILDNEAIVDMRDTHLHRKISKDNVNHKAAIENNSTEKIDNQPLNLTKNSDPVETNHRKRCYSESVLMADSLKVPQHPLNPEGSIIKDLLLKARAQANGLLPVTSETYDASETLYVCPLCQISYKSAENLEIHRSYYCKNSASTLNQNAILNISNTSDLLKFPKPEFMYMRSNSCHVTLSDTSTTNTPTKYSNSLKSPLKRANKPENLVIIRNDHVEVSTPLPSPGPLLGNTRLVDTQSISEGVRPNIFISDDIEKINRVSPALKRRTESQSSESISSLSKFSDESYQRSEIYSPPNKIRCTETPATLRSLEELSLSPMRQNSTSLQMFGGEVKITDNAGGTTTMRIEATSQQSPTMISQSRISPSMLGPETSSVLVRSGLHSGATIVHNPPTPKEPLPSPHPQTPRLLVSIAPNLTTPNYTVAGIPAPNMSKFQFPIGPITAFNPLTLPALSPVGSPSGAATILHCGKYIPYVPGMPGPNSLNSFASPTQKLNMKSDNINGMSLDSIMSNEFAFKERLKSLHNVDIESKSTSPIYSHSNMTNSNYMFERNEPVNKYVDSSIIRSGISKPGVKLNFSDTQNNLKSNISKNANFNKRLPQNKIDEILKRNTEILLNNSTDFNLKVSKNDFKAASPNKTPQKNTDDEIKHHKINEKKNSAAEMKEYNFENLISKSEILNKPIETNHDNSNQSKPVPDDSSTKAPERSETSYFKKNITTTCAVSLTGDSQNSKFLRPTSLPLKPGTFTPKRHHGITPNANTLPLISPETPRPAKAYGQLYLNGHAYTYLGLKCSTKVYYCTLNRPQPTYVPEQHSLSMYSNWQVCSESAPHPLGLPPGQAMCLYDSRHRPQNTVVSKMKQDHLMTHSSQWAVTAANQSPSVISEADKSDESRLPLSELNNASSKTSKSLAGGFESNEEYIYVPGRGRGRYVCSECGIRCKKPSMLKKHIRTHTDVRPFTCKHCSFSFKTKGNLTKHMKSKAHYRKCCELGISPLEGVDGDMLHALGDSDDDSDTHDDGNEGETESSDTDSCKSRQEHEAAHCLLSLWGGRPAPGLLSTARPTTYPYTPNTSNHTDVLASTEDSKLPETSFSPIKETASVIRQHPITQLSVKQDKPFRRSTSIMSPIDLSKPMDLSKSDAKENCRTDKSLVMCPAEDILTPVGEPDLLASLAMSTSNYPRINNWNDDDEPMLQAYLTEKALQDSRIKQCQYTNGRIRRDEAEMESPYRNSIKSDANIRETTVITSTQIIVQMSTNPDVALNHMHDNDNSGIQTLAEIAASSVRLKTPPVSSNPDKKLPIASDKPKGTENAKFVASEYLKVVCGKSNSDTESYNADINNKNDSAINASNVDDNPTLDKDGDVQKINSEHFGMARKVVVGEGSVGFKLTKLSSEFSSFASLSKGSLTEDGRSVCVVCNKTFSKPSQLLLHINIHYIERPFRCSACAVSFRTRGHLQKHERSGSHHNKVSMTSTFGTATTTNPRPFKCSDCKIAFRIHGHLAKHLRSKMHVMRLECLGKLPFGTFAEIERAGVSLTDIDTTDCDNSLASLQILAQKLHEKDPTKLDKWDPMTMTPPLLPPGHESSDEEEPSSPMAHSIHMGDHDPRIVNDSDSPDEINVKYSATNT